MTINKIRDLLTSEIKPFVENDEKNKLAAVLIIIYGKIPKILMTKKTNYHESAWRRDFISWWKNFRF